MTTRVFSPPASQASLPLHLAWALQGSLSPKLNGQGLRTTFPKKRVEKASVKWPLSSSTLGVKRVKWSMDQERGKVLLALS